LLLRRACGNRDGLRADAQAVREDVVRSRGGGRHHEAVGVAVLIVESHGDAGLALGIVDARKAEQRVGAQRHGIHAVFERRIRFGENRIGDGQALRVSPHGGVDHRELKARIANVVRLRVVPREALESRQRLIGGARFH
jgi:hypothetical protein